MEGFENTNTNRAQQADTMMNRFVTALQQMSEAIERQGRDSAAWRGGEGKVLQGLGSAIENLVEKSSVSAVPVASAESSGTTIANKVIDLAEFNGSDRSIWPTWEIQARGKAESCGPDPSVQFYAVFNKLKDNAAKNVTPWVTRNLSMGTITYEGLLEELGRLYNDPAQEAKALTNLKSMRQLEKETFANFFPKFEKELANAGGANMPASIRIMFLRTALNYRFRSCLPKTKSYDTYEELVNDLRTAASTMANEDVLSGRRENLNFLPRNLEPSAPQPSYGPSPMDWTPTVNSFGRVGESSDQRPRAQWVSKDVLKMRSDAKCCLRCGNNGHYQNKCPYRPPINPNYSGSNNRQSVSVNSALLMAEPDINGGHNNSVNYNNEHMGENGVSGKE